MDQPESGATRHATPATGSGDGSTPPRRPRHKTTQLKRLLILAAIVIVVIIIAALLLRSCQKQRKIDEYRGYFKGVEQAIGDSNSLGGELEKIVANPTKFSRNDLFAKTEELASKQSEIATRSEGFKVPADLNTENAIFVQGMRVRAEGYSFFAQLIKETLSSKKPSATKLAALVGYFSGPDAYYMSQFYNQSRKTMADQGISDVAVPTSNWYLNAKTFDRARIEAMLSSAGGSIKLTGIHGVAVLGAAAKPGDVELKAGSTVKIKATADMAFDVRVQNQGNAAEQNVPVKGEIKLSSGTVVAASTVVATIPAGKTQTATLSGFQVPSDALTKVSTLVITAGPVPGERVKTNNSVTFKILLQLE